MRWRHSGGSQQTRNIRKWCEGQVRALNLPEDGHLTIERLISYIAQRKGRKISLAPLTLPNGSPDGLWMATADEDYVLYEERLAPMHQRAVVLHELGHLICDHKGTSVLTTEALSLLLPSLDTALVRRTLGREHSHSQAEIEAEYVGSLLADRINSSLIGEQPSVPAELRELAGRLSALENPSRRR
ncbi:ImmA/IrrE family metallo-endopeptidase [Streptomyces rhizosphaericus]|uniref:ImmA/IrrE family metallo-endopeptidase n=1 Tax=Streptomyces rhizosphaericus TaxID=114699 RepID=A0A6G4ACG2_9ACTN|nr:ImmA/IrrE family metallo-endopeptidase [Streptomyces rhizosphaericus]